METPRKFIIANVIIVYLRGVSTKLNKYIVFTMQTYKKLIILYGFTVCLAQYGCDGECWKGIAKNKENFTKFG